MANPEFHFLVKTPGTYPESGRARSKMLDADARSHAAMAYHRKKYRAVDPRALDTTANRPPHGLLLKSSYDRPEEELRHQEIFLSLKPDQNGARRQMTPLEYPIDILPGIPHGEIPGFAAAAEFYFSVDDMTIHAPLFHVFDVSNTFGQCYYELAGHEVGLYAGIAVVSMVSEIWRQKSFNAGPSQHARRLVQMAMSKLRQCLMEVETSPGSKGSRGKAGTSSDAAIIAAMFLGHMSTGFGDAEAFRLHRQGIKAMIESRGGLDALGLDGMVKCSVLQFESWWTHLYNDTSVFASYKTVYDPTFLLEPLSPQKILSPLSDLPPGFSHLAVAGKLATDTITILSNITSYQRETHHLYNPTDQTHGALHLGRLQDHVSQLASLPHKKRYDDFWQACSCLLVTGPHFEKYLVFALMLFASVAFAPGEEAHRLLACSHTVFRTPRACLRRELPGFQIPTVRAEQWEDGQWEGGRIETHDIRAVEKTMRECLIWIWLVLIDSWRATDGVESVDAMQLQDLLIIDFPECAGWDSVEIILTRFFYTEEMRTKLKCSWRESTGPTMSTGEDSL